VLQSTAPWVTAPFRAAMRWHAVLYSN